MEIAQQTSPDAPHGLETIVAEPSAVETTCEWLCAACLIGMVVMIGAEAVARNLFHTSLQITDELGGYLLVAVTFLSMSVAEAHGAYHRVELIQIRLGRRARILSQLLFDLMALAAVVILTWQLTRLALNSWRSEDVAPTPLQTPLWLPQSVMGLGTAVLCLALLRTMHAKVLRLREPGSA